VKIKEYHVFVQVSGVNLAADKDEDSWKTMYFLELIHDDVICSNLCP